MIWVQLPALMLGWLTRVRNSSSKDLTPMTSMDHV